MASSGDKTVRVPIGVPVETNAAKAADDVSGLRDQIARSRDVMKDAAAQMRSLAGKSAEVKAAKDQLKATIDRERASVSTATLGLLKHGTSYEKLADKAKLAGKHQADFAKATEKADPKKSAGAFGALNAAVTKVGGPLASARDRLKAFAEAARESGGGMGIATMAAGGLAAACVALTVALGAGVISLARWALRGADAARSLQLVREASTTSALNAKNLGTQIDALAGKVPTSVAALNDLAASLARSGISGVQAVDTLNAVAQANAAVGDASGAKIREIVERGKLMGRMFLGLRELAGTGLDFEDVAGALAKDLGVGIKDARAALLEGRVKLGDGAKAMRTAVETKFGGINLRKLMSIEGLTDQISKKFAKMTAGIDLDRAGASVFKFIQIFDESTATGAVLKRAVTAFGSGIVTVIERGTPIAKAFIRGLIIGGLEIYIAYLRVRNTLRDAFTGNETLKGIADWIGKIDGLKAATDSGVFVMRAMAMGVGVVAAGLALIVAPIVAGHLAFKAFVNAGADTMKWFASIDWSATGSAIVDGIVDGLKGGAAKLVNAAGELGDKLKVGFKSALGIRSPSTVFEAESKQIPAGAAKGIRAGSPAAQRAVDEMVTPSGSSGVGAAGGGAALGGARPPVVIYATLSLEGGGGGAAAKVSDPGTLEAFTKLLKEAAAAAGLGTATVTS